MTRPIAATLLLLLSVPAATVAAAAPAAVEQAVADPTRPKVDRDADALRKPAETLAFAGVRPGMTVGEFFPGGGYYTRMLSDVVGPKGHVYGLDNAAWEDPGQPEAIAKGRSNVSIDAQPFGQFTLPGPVDLIWITQNYHDLKIAKYGAVDTADFNRRVFKALKPGGIYVVLDHEAPAGTSDADIARLHRMEKAKEIAEITAAGFKLQAEGTFLRRPEDDHTLSIFDPAIKGKTDQYALRFVKPRG